MSSIFLGTISAAPHTKETNENNWRMLCDTCCSLL